jgi:hypothetical protein
MAREKWTGQFFIAAPPLMNRYPKDGEIWKELEKTKKRGPISASLLQLFKNGGQSNISYKNTELAVQKNLFQFTFAHFDFSSMTGYHFRMV